MKITSTKHNVDGHWLDSWHVDPSANRTYDFVDGLRGVAILMVLACHLIHGSDHGSLALRYGFSLAGQMGKGVDLFFTISGFLISWPFWKRKAGQNQALIPPGYGWRRFWKIYPPLALSVLLLTPGYILWLGNAPGFCRAAGQWITGLAFIMPVSGIFNPVMWSLVVEIHFYVALPLLFLLTKPWSGRTCLWIISLFLLVVPVSLQIFTGLQPTFTPEITDPYCIGLRSFCFGVAVAGIDALKLWNKNWARIGDAGWLAVVVGLAGVGWVQMNSSAHAIITPYLFHWLFVLGTGCLLCYAASPDNPRARWLCAPWLRWCGIISYEWYLFHQPMVYWVRDWVGPAGGNIIKVLLSILVPFAASLLTAALVYRKFSLPILQFGRARNRRPSA